MFMNKLFKKKKGENLVKMISRASSEYELKDTYQGITLDQVEGTLGAIGRHSPDIKDVIWCLLIDDVPSLFSKAKHNKLCDGATTAQIATFVGVLMRKGEKLDREGRDYWIKPLRELGAIEACTYSPGVGFLPGHLVPKSPNSAYKIAPGFLDLIKAYGSKEFKEHMEKWISSDSVRARLKIQADLETVARSSSGGNSHKDLINASIEVYTKNYLPGYILIYKDDSDGDRITDEEQALMKKYNIELGIADSFPDVILYNEKLDSLWFIEAVTSDGEVDEHKLAGLKAICTNSGKSFAGSTTTYMTWKAFAQRQQSVRNLANTSMVWIYEDPEKQLKVEHLK